jgi:AcrR family transcriptional regulator
LNRFRGLHVAAQGHRANAPLRKIRAVPASTKARILLAAEEVFASQGFEGASTREIAAKAGVNISSLHYHWESKDRLYDAVFRNVYGQLIEISRDAVPPIGPRSESARNVSEASVGRIFDYFAANPNIPRLLLRRILENGELGDAVEPDVFLSSWTRGLGEWMKRHGGRRVRDVDARAAVLTLHSALLLFTLDSRQYARALGGGIADPEIARRLRAYLVEVCARLVFAGPKPST